MKFEIFGNPIPLQRHRTTIVKGKILAFDSQSKERDFVRNKLKYLLNCACRNENPEISKEAKELCFGDKYSLDIQTHHPVPKSAKKLVRMRMETGLEYHNKKPDGDNLYKWIADCCNGIFYSDDSKIVKGSFLKLYSLTPKVVIFIERI